MATAAGPQTTLHRDGQILPLALAVAKVYKGAAAAVVIGTGFGTPLVPTTVTHQFVGVFAETYDNTAGSAGGYFSQVVRSGPFVFNSSGITAASIGQPAFFSDDTTVTTTPGTTYAGQIVAVDAAGNVWVDITEAVRAASNYFNNVVTLSGATDAINPHISAKYVLTRAGVDAATLAAPTALVDDGKIIQVSSTTANAHTLTATGLFQCGTASVNLATFAAQAGAGLTLMAFNAKWIVLASVGITFS